MTPTLAGSSLAIGPRRVAGAAIGTARLTLGATAPAPTTRSLLYVRSPTEGTGQAALRAALEVDGRWSVTSIADTALTDAVVAAAQDIVIGAGTTSATVMANAPTLKTTTRPVTCFNSGTILATTGLAITNVASGQTSATVDTSVRIPDTRVGHPLAAGLPAGDVAYFTSTQAMNNIDSLKFAAGAERVLNRPAATTGTFASSILIRPGGLLGDGTTAAGYRAFGQWLPTIAANIFTPAASALAVALVAEGITA